MYIRVRRRTAYGCNVMFGDRNEINIKLRKTSDTKWLVLTYKYTMCVYEYLRIWAHKYSLFVLLIRNGMRCLRMFLPTSVKNYDQKLRTNMLRNVKKKSIYEKKVYVGEP